MLFTTEELGDIPNVDGSSLDEILRQEGFGKFAILSTNDEEFIQAGSDWQPGPECAAFLEQHDSDPWILEYRLAGRQFRAAGYVTLGQLRVAFRSYLLGDSEWRSAFRWNELET